MNRTSGISPAIGISYRHYIDPMASSEEKDDIAYAMTPFKIISWTIGVWPLQVYDFFSQIRSGFSICSAFLVVSLSSIDLYMGCTNAEQNIDCLMLICCGTLGILKMIFFRIYARNLTNNYNSAVVDYLTNKNVEERTIMRKHAFIVTFFHCSLMLFTFVSIMLIGLIPFLRINENKINITNDMLEYPIPSRCCMSYLNVPTSMYKIVYLIQTGLLLVTNWTNNGNDMLFLNIVMHLCGQVKILRNNIVDFDVTSPQIYDRFNALIQRHSYLIKLARELADTINFILLMQLFLTSILLCIIGFQFILALKVNDTALMIKSTLIYSSFLMQITTYCAIGDYLKSQMEKIAFSIYQNAWYDLPIKLRQRLIFIIMRTKFPVALQAGNFIMINLPTYMNILKTSVSYLSVLRIMVEI